MASEDIRRYVAAVGDMGLPTYIRETDKFACSYEVNPITNPNLLSSHKLYALMHYNNCNCEQGLTMTHLPKHVVLTTAEHVSVVSNNNNNNNNNKSVALVCERTIPTELEPTFADRGYRVVSAADPYGRNIDFLDRSRSFYSK
jgi:hypothetical protein